MGNWSLTGVFLIVGVFFALFGLALSQLQIDNPYTNMQSSLFQLILDWLNPLW